MMHGLRKFFVVVPVVLTIFAAQGLQAQDTDDPPARVGRLSSLSGQVSLEPSGVNQWSAGALNYPVATGDRLYSDQDGRAEVQIGEIVVRLWHGTDLSMTNLSDEMVQLGLAQGTLHLGSNGLQANEDVEIDTPNGAVTVIRPGDIRIDAYPGDAGSVVTVDSGQVQISGPNFSQFVSQGQSIRLVGSNPIAATYIAMAGYDEFDSWSMARDRRMQASESARYVSRDVPGYDDLDEYGDWDAQTDYGPVWYPRAVPVGWVPYRYGHWVWTGPWGWTWVEDEPWGYAPFHYGRWVFFRNRWGWVPGPVVVRPVWSPALVAFVGGSGVSAWFPLGPGEPYHPWYRCSPRYVNQVNITNIRVTKVVVVQNNYNVTNINNIHYNYRTTAVTAVRADAFASARPVHENLVRLDPNQLRQVQVVARPEIRPTAVSVVARPVNRVPVSTMHPVLLTRGGRQMMASPGARPEPVPVRPLPPAARGNMGGVRSTMVPAPADAGRAIRPVPAAPQNEIHQQMPQRTVVPQQEHQPEMRAPSTRPAVPQERPNPREFSRPEMQRPAAEPRPEQNTTRPPQQNIRPMERQESRPQNQNQPQQRPQEVRPQPQVRPEAPRQEQPRARPEERKQDDK